MQKLLLNVRLPFYMIIAYSPRGYGDVKTAIGTLMFEFSTAIDLQKLPEFWKQIGSLVNDGLMEEEVKKICKFAENIPENSTDALPMDLMFRNESVDLDLVVSKNYLSPYLHLFSSSSDLIESISEKYRDMCSDLEI